MGISVGGIVSGIDTDTMVTQLVAAARAPQTVMKADLSDLEDLKDTYETLVEKVTALQDAYEAIDSADELRATTAASSDEGAVTVEADGGAVAGRYSIEVTSLAANETEVSDGFSDKDTTGTIAEGTLSVTYAGTTTALTVDSTNSSLEELADLINDNVEGVTAYIMDTGDATSPYRLVVTGKDTGASNTLTLDTSGMTGTGTVPTFTETSTAADAALTVNGIAITSADNAIDDVVSGITFNLEDVTTSAITVTVETDLDTTVENLNTFVTAYNELRTYIRTHRAYDADNDIKGEFVGESTVVGLMQSLQSVVGAAYTTGGVYESLGSIGFETQQDGSIEIDEDVLRAALEDSPEDIVALFEADAGTFGDALADLITNYTDEDEGYLTLRTETIDGRITDLETDIDDFDTRMDSYEARLRKQFTAMELALAKLNDASAQLAAMLGDGSSSSSSSSSS